MLNLEGYGKKQERNFFVFLVKKGKERGKTGGGKEKEEEGRKRKEKGIKDRRKWKRIGGGLKRGKVGVNFIFQWRE